MNLQQLLADIKSLNEIANPEQQIDALYYDSRKVQAGGLFFALPGEQVDGCDYIPAAVTAGAVAIVAQRTVMLPDGVQLILVEDARQAMAAMAAAFYGYPARDLLTIGVTGTNGKTTMTYLLESLLLTAGYQPIVIGTVSNRLGAVSFEACNTTPESLDLQRMLAEFRQQGGDALVIEVSSHALMQSRIHGLSFDVAVFTNLTPEHLDYHKNMASYFAAKSILFTDPQLIGDGKVVVNSDDPYGAKLLTMVDNGISVGTQPWADVYVSDFAQSLNGIDAVLQTSQGEMKLHSPLIGRYNMENLSCGVGAGLAIGMSLSDIQAGLAGAHTVPGRLERIDNDLSALIVVDYAHTGDALEKVLQAVAALNPARIITLFGCGGDRDTSKRAVMAAVATRYSALVVITSDNPRTEDPALILADIRQGIPADVVEYDTGCSIDVVGDGSLECKYYVVIEDRGAAIQFAVDQLQQGDLLLVAGKGHEDYQIIGTKKIHFDDCEQLKRALKLRATSACKLEK